MSIHQYPGKGDYSLKRSIIVDPPHQTVNLTPTRGSSGRRSFNQQSGKYPQSPIQNTIRYDPTAFNSQKKHQSYISLGDKNKHNRELSRDLPSLNMEKKIQQISVKVERLCFNIEMIEKRIAGLDTIKKQQVAATDSKQVIKQLINQVLTEYNQHFALQNKLFKADLDTLKIQLKGFVERKQIEKRIQPLENSVKESFKSLKELKDNYYNKMDSVFQANRKNQQKKFYLGGNLDIEKQIYELKNSIKQLSQRSKEKIKEVSFTGMLQKEYLGIPLTLEVESKVSATYGVTKVPLAQKKIIYKIDPDGYLLDESQHYILDENNKMIKLSVEHQQMLKEKNLLF